MAERGNDLVVLAEVFLDRFRLGGRLDDDEILGHQTPNSASRPDLGRHFNGYSFPGIEPGTRSFISALDRRAIIRILCPPLSTTSIPEGRCVPAYRAALSRTLDTPLIVL